MVEEAAPKKGSGFFGFGSTKARGSDCCKGNQAVCLGGDTADGRPVGSSAPAREASLLAAPGMRGAVS